MESNQDNIYAYCTFREHNLYSNIFILKHRENEDGHMPSRECYKIFSILSNSDNHINILVKNSESFSPHKKKITFS